MIIRAIRKIGRIVKVAVIKIENGNRLILGHNFSIRSNFNIRIKNSGKVIIGDNVFLNNFCSINCMESIRIGNNCIFGEGVRIYDHNHQYSRGDFPIYKQGYISRPIEIGNNCWIGSNVIILPGVVIGSNSVIGTSVIVHNDIPENSIVKSIQSQEIRQIERK